MHNETMKSLWFFSSLQCIVSRRPRGLCGAFTEKHDSLHFNSGLYYAYMFQSLQLWDVSTDIYSDVYTFIEQHVRCLIHVTDIFFNFLRLQRTGPRKKLQSHPKLLLNSCRSTMSWKAGSGLNEQENSLVHLFDVSLSFAAFEIWILWPIFFH